MGVNSPFRERETQSQEILREVSSPRAPDYLATRVLARLRTRRRPSLREWFWRAWVPTSAVWLIFLSWSMLKPQTSGYHAPIHQAMAVRLAAEAEDRQPVIRAEINLPPGVVFHSQRFPYIKKLRTLHLRNLKKPVRFVVQGQSVGKREIQVRYFDSKDQMTMVRTVTIHFQKRSQS